MSVTLASVGSHLYIIAQTFATERPCRNCCAKLARGVGAWGGNARRGRAEGREETDVMTMTGARRSSRPLRSVTQPTDDDAGRLPTTSSSLRTTRTLLHRLLLFCDDAVALCRLAPLSRPRNLACRAIHSVCNLIRVIFLCSTTKA